MIPALPGFGFGGKLKTITRRTAVIAGWRLPTTR